MADIETPPPDPDGRSEPGVRDADVGLPKIGELVARGLEVLDTDGEEGFERFCAEHPDDGEAITRHVRALAGTGLVGGGRRFGHYRVLRPLGRGGMGVVSLAEDTRLGRLVALKALPSQLVQSDRAMERFRREARAVAGLRHPCIVPVYDVGEDDGQPFFTMEFVDGRTLDAVVAELRGLERPTEQLDSRDLGRAAFADDVAGDDAADAPSLPRAWGRAYVPAICRLVLDVADALEHAHRHGIVHRDVKPSNVLVGRDGRAQLFDFGLARSDTAEALTLTGDFTGTPYYVSPEQASGGQVDARSDVFSLGVTLYELLTLTRPFEGRTNHEVFKRIHGSEPVAPRRRNPAIPRDLETICLTALEKDPARRYPSAADMAADLLRFLDHRPLRAKPVGPVERAWRWARRNKAAASAIALGAVVLIATPVGLYLHGRALGEANDELAATVTSLERANRINTSVHRFLLDVFGAADPLRGSADVTVAEKLDDASALAAVEFADEPEVEAALRQLLGHSFEGLGRYDEALFEYERVLELRRELVSGDSPELRAALSDVGVVLARTGRLHDARARFVEALEIAERLGDALGDDERADAHFNLATLAFQTDDDDEASEHAVASRVLRASWLESVDDDARADALDDLAASHVLLGNLARRQLDDDEAERHYRAALDLLADAAPDAVRASIARSELASLYGAAGRWEDADALYAEALDASIARRGEAHGATAALRVDRAETLLALRRLDEALEHLTAAQDYHGRDGARAMRIRATVLAELGRLDEAADAAAVGMLRTTVAMDLGSFADVDATLALADIAARAGRRDTAITWLEGAAARAARVHGDEHWTVRACRERIEALREG